MTKGDKRRNRRSRKYRVRYDRIVILALIVIVITVLVTSCTKALSGKDKPDDTKKKDPKPDASDSDQQTTEPLPEDDHQETTTEPDVSQLSGYETITMDKSEIYKGDLVLVNAAYEYKFPEGDIEPVTVWDHQNNYYSYGDMATSFDSKALVQLNNMIETYAAESSLSVTDIFVQDGYRTFEEQEIRHSSGRSKTFEAGHADYHTGRTIDLFRFNESGDSAFMFFSAEGQCEWFAENSGRFGFIVRYPAGKDEITGEKSRTYTYRYVGAPHAQYINENNLCLEEYIDLVKTHTNESQLTVKVNDHTYGVYYIAADADKVDVPVPTQKEYTVSGNNADGFVVTVTID